MASPRDATGPHRVLRFWAVFTTGDWSGFYHLHEDAEGAQQKFNDVFGTPFAGKLFKGWGEEELELTAGRHEMEFERLPNSSEPAKLLKKATLHLTDNRGRPWMQTFETASPPWVTQTMGYTLEGWRQFPHLSWL